MRAAIGAGVLLFVLGVALALVQLWVGLWSPETFLKVELTVAAMLLVVVVVSYVVREYREDAVTRSGDRLDD